MPDRDDALARVLDRRQPRGLVGELHDVPPWMLPALLASVMPIQWVSDRARLRDGLGFHTRILAGRGGSRIVRRRALASATLQCQSSHRPRRMRCRAFPGACRPSSKPRSQSCSIAPRIPSETLEYSYQKQIELLQNVKKGIADVVTSKKRLQLQEEKLQQQVVKLDTQARQALAAGQRGSRPDGAGAQERRPDRAAVARLPGRPARAAAGADDRLRAEAAHQDRAVPLQEGGRQGPVLGRRGPGQDLRGRHRRRRGDGRRRAGHAARAGQDREHEGARRCRRRARGVGDVRGPDRARIRR